MVNTPDAPSTSQTNFVSVAGDSVTVPDAKLMFTGDYSRSGENLVLSGDDGASLVIGGYFASETPATLVSPSGSILTGDVVQSLAGPMFPGQYAQAGTPEGAQPIGTVVSLSGTASAKRANGLDIELNSGDPVFQGDVIQTGADSAVGLSFADKSVFNMSANARMVLNEFVYDAGGSSNKMLFNFVEGTFSFVSGQVAPTGDMKLQTPVAVMAIRGTAPVADINLDQGTINFYLTVLPGKPPGSYNLEDFDGNVLVVVDDPAKGVTLTSAGGTPQVFEVTGANLVFLQNLTQLLLNTIEQSQSGPEENLENLLKKITGSPFFENFEGFDGVGPEGSGPSGPTPFGTIPLPEPISFPGSDTQQDAFVVVSVNVVPPQPDPDVAEPPTLVVTGDLDLDGALTAKEDGSGTIVVDVAAAAGSNDVISQIVITGLDPNARYVINDLQLEPGATSFTLAVPEAGDFGATETVTIEVTPSEDSDVDLTDLTVTATAQDGNSPNLTADAGVTIPIVIDAVLDEFLALTGTNNITVNGTANEGLPVPLGLTALLEDPEFGGLIQSDPDGDGSEQVTMTVSVSAGGVLVFIDLAELGIEVDASVPGQWTFTGTTQSDWQTLAQSFAIDPDDQFGEGQITATFSIQTQEANTPEGTVGESGGEPDTADNTANANLTVTLNFEVADSPALAVSGDVDANGTLTVKEDGFGTIIVDVAAAAASDDVISQIVITGLDPSASYVINGQQLDAETTSFTLPLPEAGDFGATETVTIVVTPGEDSDVDLSSLTVTATTQDSDLPDATASAGVTVPIVVDAVLDEALELTVAPPNFYELLFGNGEYAEHAYQGEYGSAPEGGELDAIPLGLAALIKNTSFLGSGSGGTDNDNSEQVAMTVVISAGGILMFTDVQALGIQVDTSVEGEWTFSGTTQSDWNTLVSSFAVTPADGFVDGEIVATFSIQTQEANTPEGTVAASGGESDTADNTANFDLTLTLDIQHQGEELVGLDGEGGQIRLAFFSDSRANPDNFDYDRGGTINNGADRDSEWEDILGGGDLDFNDLQFNVEILIPGEVDGIELQPTTNFGVSEGDLVYELPADSLLTINVDNLFSNAGFDTTLGFYLADASGTPLEGYILVPNANEPGVVTATFTIDTSEVDPSAVLLGFFIIPDGYEQNDLSGVQHVEFIDGDLGGFVAVDMSDFVVTASTDEGVVWEFDSQTYEYVNDLSTSSELPVIAGTDAENLLTGTQGDEILVGFGGQDTLTGNGGNNLFVLTDLAIHDLITDYGEFDAIDVGSFSFSLAAGEITEADLEEFVRYISPNDNDSDQSELGGSAGDLFINVDGTGDPADFTLVAQLQNTPDSVTIQVDSSDGATNEVVIA